MIFGSVCSGIEAASVAWEPLGWRAAWLAETDKGCSALLAHRWPQIKNLGDFTLIRPQDHEPIDLLVGGTPCQSFSVAGLRRGLDDDRGKLALEFCRLADRARPRWLVWENVPGVLSKNGGRDFGSFLGALAELGYGFAYRVLDARFFGVPQRRRRVILVANLGDWRRAAAVLFERESLRRDTPARSQPRQDLAPTIAARTSAGGGLGTDFDCDCDGGLVANGGNNTAGPIDVATAVNAHGGPHGRLDFESETFIAFSGKDYGADAGSLAPTLRAMGHDGSHANAGGQIAVAYDLRGREGGSQFEGPHNTANLRSPSGGSSRSYVQAAKVRRLTPRECERLQGFPDDYTLIPLRNKAGLLNGKWSKDGPRYKQLGNSMAIPCMRWIGKRIQMVDQLVPALVPA